MLAVGALGLGVWLGSMAIPAIWQDWANWSFDREVRGQPAAITDYLSEKKDQVVGIVHPSTAVAARRQSHVNGSLVGRLTIPRLGLKTIVEEGVGEDTLGFGAGHIPGTAWPGERGNVGIAGHRDKIFRSLKGIRKDDLIRFETLNGSHVYRVQSTEIVTPKDVKVLKGSRSSELTLVTCYPFYYIGSAPDRFIVKAREVSP